MYAARAGARGGPAQDDVDRAVDHLERARGQLTTDAGVYLALGRLYVATQESAKAIEVLNEVLEVEPRFIEALVLLAQAHEAQSEWVEAAAAVRPRRGREPRPGAL